MIGQQKEAWQGFAHRIERVEELGAAHGDADGGLHPRPESMQALNAVAPILAVKHVNIGKPVAVLKSNREEEQ